MSSGLLLWVTGSAPALAACCELEHLEVRRDDGAAVRIEAAELTSSLEPHDLELLYWPALNGSRKSMDRPAGNLGPAYDVTYVLRNAARDAVVEVRETVYPKAPGGPAAFAAAGQTVSFKSGKTSAVPAGWRPFPEHAAGRLQELVSSPDDGSGPPRLVWIGLVGAALAAAGIWRGRRRPTAAPSRAPA